MKKNEFYKELVTYCDLVTNDLNDNTKLEDIEGYDSLAILTMIAFIDEKFGVSLAGQEFLELSTLISLVEKIGIEKFEDD